MKIALAADHAGFVLKKPIGELLELMGHEVLDLGAAQYDAHDDYPDFAEAVARALQRGQAVRGILICGSGVGACVGANKFRGVRACICHDTYSAAQGVQHDNMNVLCLGARVVGQALALELVKAFVNASFSGEERHARRLAKIEGFERDGGLGPAGGSGSVDDEAGTEHR